MGLHDLLHRQQQLFRVCSSAWKLTWIKDHACYRLASYRHASYSLRLVLSKLWNKLVLQKGMDWEADSENVEWQDAWLCWSLMCQERQLDTTRLVYTYIAGAERSGCPFQSCTRMTARYCACQKGCKCHKDLRHHAGSEYVIMPCRSIFRTLMVSMYDNSELRSILELVASIVASCWWCDLDCFRTASCSWLQACRRKCIPW